MFENRYIVYAHNKVLYHAILFASFMIAILLIPWMQSLASNYIANNFLQKIASYVAAYIAATYILPEIGFMLAKNTQD